MSYADSVFICNCINILGKGISDEGFNVRPKWEDGTPAHTVKSLYAVDRYDLSKDPIPMVTLRKGGIKNAIDEILWIYQKKSSKLEDLHSHIWDSWDMVMVLLVRLMAIRLVRKPCIKILMVLMLLEIKWIKFFGI